MSEDQILKMKDAKEKMSAYSDFLEHGIEWVRKHYPHQEKFIESVKGRKENDVIEELQDLTSAKVQN